MVIYLCHNIICSKHCHLVFVVVDSIPSFLLSLYLIDDKLLIKEPSRRIDEKIIFLSSPEEIDIPTKP